MDLGNPLLPVWVRWPPTYSYIFCTDSYGFPQSVALSELPGSRFRGRNRDLVTDIRTLRSYDITDVVCLLTEAEFRKFRVPTLLSDYENAGFVVYHLPIEDGNYFFVIQSTSNIDSDPYLGL